MDPDDRVVQSVRSPVVVGPTSTVGPEELSQRGRRIPTTFHRKFSSRMRSESNRSILVANAQRPSRETVMCV
jgi:hypothetical protein